MEMKIPPAAPSPPPYLNFSPAKALRKAAGAQTAKKAKGRTTNNS